MKTLLIIILWIIIGTLFAGYTMHKNGDHEDAWKYESVCLCCWPVLLLICIVASLLKLAAHFAEAVCGFLDKHNNK